jgi:hypothetical protein
MGGWVKNSEQGTKGTREQRAEKPATERPGGGGGVERQGGGGKAGNKPPQRRRPVAGGPGRDQGNREQGTEKKLLAPGFWPLACLAESVSREYRNERAKRLKAAFGSWLPVLRAETAALLASLFPRSLGPLAPRSLIPSVPPFWSLFACSPWSLGPCLDHWNEYAPRRGNNRQTCRRLEIRGQGSEKEGLKAERSGLFGRRRA